MGTTVNKDIFCYFSEIGNKNFYYPTCKKGFIKNGAQYEVLPWISTNKTLQPIKIKNKYIVGLTIEQNNTTINNTEKYSVVWIKKPMPLSSVG